MKSMSSIFFMILTIYNGSPPLFCFGMLESTAEKTHWRVAIDEKNMKMRNVETSRFILT